MGIPNLLRYEVQIARTGRALCRICGVAVEKDTFIMKVLGFRINQSLHPECVAKLTLGLVQAEKQLGSDRDYVLRAFDGTVKIGYYADTEDPKKKRFTTIKVVHLGEPPKPEEPIKLKEETNDE